MRVVSRYGIRWARNPANIKKLRKGDPGDPHGVYILCDGSLPVYVGRGRIWARIRQHERGRKGRYWDHFSWFAVDDHQQESEIEALLLRMLPVSLRILNKQRANFRKARRCKEPDQETRPAPIKLGKYAIGRKRGKS